LKLESMSQIRYLGNFNQYPKRRLAHAFGKYHTFYP
jgi:hypothetical protein